MEKTIACVYVLTAIFFVIYGYQNYKRSINDYYIWLAFAGIYVVSTFLVLFCI